jgi:ATP-dependent helicase/nuclease subunit A
MTIHGAKGLESPFVIVLDTNNTAMPNFGRGILLDWDPDTNAPHHLSMFTKTSLSQARSHLKEQEKGIALHENWNLLYVALSRAKQGLWLSAVESSKNRKQNGLLKDSWYDRAMLASIPLFEELDLDQTIGLSKTPQRTESTSSIESRFEYHDIVLSWQGAEPIKNIEPISMDQQRRMDEGDWFHQVMQRITPQQYRPVVNILPSTHSIARLLNISEADAQKTLQRAQQVCECKDLIQYFDPSLYIDAWNELDLINYEGKSLRVDRLVEFENELVILDYKLSIPDQSDPLFEQYQTQLSNYREALRPLYPSKSIKTLLIDSQGRSLQFH